MKLRFTPPPSHLLLVTLGLLLAAICAAIPASAQLQQLKGHVPDIVKNGQAPLVSILPSNQKMHLSIVLPIRNKPVFDQLRRDLYNPASPKYRQFLAPEQFAQQFSPSRSDYQKVIDFARSNGFTVTNMPSNRMILSLDGTAAQVEQAFHVHMNLYRDLQDKRNFYAPDREPTLTLSTPILAVAGLSNVSMPRPMIGGGYQSGGNTPVYYPYTMRTAYYGSGNLTGTGQCIGIGELQGYNIEEVVNTLQANGNAQASYQSSGNGNYIVSYTPPGTSTAYSIPITNISVDGGSISPTIPPPGYNGSNAYYKQGLNDEAEVVADISQAIGIAPGASIYVYIAPWGDISDAQDLMSEMTRQQSTTQTYCNQLSFSWGWSLQGYDTQLGTIFETMASEGQAMFVSSGDSGGWNGGSLYPAEDPNVIAVGGTELTLNGSGSYVSEAAWPSSGGGISTDGFTSEFQGDVETACNHASPTLRNVPDVAMEANSDNYSCSLESPYPNCATNWSGTSIATPRWAGFMALANQYAVKQSRAPSGGSIGSIYDVIYTIGRSSAYTSNMRDITSGNNVIYNACPGYDLVTGWGSPNSDNAINSPSSNNTIQALVYTSPSSPLPASSPYQYDVNVSTQGVPPTSITATMYLGDATPDAVIYYQVTICGNPQALTSAQPGTYLQLVNYCPSMPESGYMYAVAPNYTTSQTVSMSF